MQLFSTRTGTSGGGGSAGASSSASSAASQTLAQESVSQSFGNAPFRETGISEYGTYSLLPGRLKVLNTRRRVCYLNTSKKIYNACISRISFL